MMDVIWLIVVARARLLRMAALIAFALLLAVATEMQGQQPFVHANDIRFSIRTDRKTFHVGDEVVIHYTITNVSNGALYVPAGQWDMKCGTRPHLWSWVEDRSGKHYEPGFGFSCGSPDPVDGMRLSERMRKDALRLGPGKAVGGTFRFDSKVFAESLSPGVYRLEAILYGWNVQLENSQLSELAGMGAPFLIGESTASSTIELRAARK